MEENSGCTFNTCNNFFLYIVTAPNSKHHIAIAGYLLHLLYKKNQVCITFLFI